MASLCINGIHISCLGRGCVCFSHETKCGTRELDEINSSAVFPLHIVASPSIDVVVCVFHETKYGTKELDAIYRFDAGTLHRMHLNLLTSTTARLKLGEVRRRRADVIPSIFNLHGSRTPLT